MSENINEMVAWTPDEALIRKIFTHIDEACRLSTMGQYQPSFLNFEFAWHVIRTTLTDRISTLKEGSAEFQDIENTIRMIDEHFKTIGRLLMPSNKPNDIARNREEAERLFALYQNVNELHGNIMIAMNLAKIWFKMSRHRSPGEAILEKFDNY